MNHTVGHNPQDVDVTVLGAGAAGLYCALECAEKGLKVQILEKNPKAGRKIMVSGGGRCNFTHLDASPNHYISQNPHFCKSALATYSPHDFLARLKLKNLGWVEKKKNQLFAEQGAKAILNMLLDTIYEYGVDLYLNCEVTQITHHEKGFEIQTPKKTWSSKAVVVATGGLSWPKLGISDIGYKIANAFGHKITKRQPGLVPFLWNESDHKKYSGLSGVSTEAKITHNKHTFEDGLLFTHHGLSGPLILQISSYWNVGEELTLEWCSEKELHDFFKGDAKHSLQMYLTERHPKRWIQAFIPEDLLHKKVGNLSKLEIQEIKQLLCHCSFTPKDQAGYGKAEVTLGGVDTKDISSKTMESQRQPNLYFIGEVLDVTGQLGGFNFQWAWASAAAAARGIAKF